MVRKLMPINSERLVDPAHFKFVGHKRLGASLSDFELPIPELNMPGIAKFYRLMLMIWEIRVQDLQKLFEISNVSGRLQFLYWCVVHGRREYAALRELHSLWNELCEPAQIKLTKWSSGISKLLHLIALTRKDLASISQLDSEQSQCELLVWFCNYGRRELGLDSELMPSWQRDFLNGTTSVGLQVWQWLVYVARPELRAQFDLRTPIGIQNLRQEFQSDHYKNEFAWLDRCDVSSPDDSSIEGVQYAMGVNLIGHAYGELGIGEDVRMAAYTLKEMDIPFTVLNFEPGPNVSQGDKSIEKWVGEHPIYLFNLFCLAAPEHLRYLLEKGNKNICDRYNIGYWPWELEHWPAEWGQMFSLVDEVWCASEHTARAVRAVSPVPVLTMPLAAALPRFKRISRSEVELPEHRYLFVFLFDGNSGIHRKNPLAIVEAFLLAFKHTKKSVSLVIKAMRVDPDDQVWRKILRHANEDSRIVLQTGIMSRSKVLALLQCCDCFVSLHRAEGFGRGLAEARLLGLDIITTGYSGNLDFCTGDERTHLVPYRMVPVRTGEYPHALNQQWADPDVEVAARMMLDVASRKSQAARTRQKNKVFTPREVGAAYRERLSVLSRRFQ